jgi:hypothetical protein
MARAIRKLNKQGHPAVIYLHPYEFAPEEVDWFRRRGFSMSYKRYFMQSLWRRRVPVRLGRLLKEFRFAPMNEVLEPDQPVCGENTTSKVAPSVAIYSEPNFQPIS